MSRRMLTLACAAVLVVVLSAAAALLPVPYVVLQPGPPTNTLGKVSGVSLIRIEGRKTYPTKGHLDLTTVSVLGGPPNEIDLVTALSGWVNDTLAVVPKEQLYPEGVDAEQVEEEGAVDMRRSQTNATTAALRHLKIPVKVRLVVEKLTKKTRAKGKLRPGDIIVSADGEPVDGGTRLREIITRHKAGEKVSFVIKRNGKRMSTSVRTAPAPDDGRPVIGILTRDETTYPFTVEIKLEDVGGPSAGIMFALGIVDKLTPGAMNGGRHVAGTGTIDDRGRVGGIGGIPQKMVGAERAGATVFLVPAENCKEAASTVPPGLRLIKVATLDGAVAALDALREGRSGIPTCAS